MQSLLRWSIENSTPQDGSTATSTAASSQKFDPEIIDMILGKPDAEQMKEDVATATDSSKSEDVRLSALDHLEMLVEQIDNANDLEKLNLWRPLVLLLNSPEASTQIKVQVLWVIGTALQNNPAAQDAYLAYEPLPTILGFLTPPSSSTLAARGKAIYVLSGLLKHNVPAVDELGKPGIDGWLKLRDALQDPDITVRRKTVFLLNTLILPVATAAGVAPPAPITSTRTHQQSTTQPSSGVPQLHTVDEPNANNPDPIHANSHSAHLRDPSRTDTSEISLEAFERFDIVWAVVSAVTNPLPFGEDGEHDKPDPDFEGKAVRMLYTYSVSCREIFTDQERGLLRQWLAKEKTESGGLVLLSERLNLSVTELDALIRRLD